MSFWTQVARTPVILGTASIASSLATVAFPNQASLFQGLSALFAGATLHAVNPNPAVAQVSVTNTAPVPVVATPKVPTVATTTATVTTGSGAIDNPVPVQQAPIGLTPDQVAFIVAQTISALTKAQATQPATQPQ